MDGANLTTGQAHQYCLTVTGGPLRVALVWHDPPALLSAASALVNDLDLQVRAAGLNGYPLLVSKLHYHLQERQHLLVWHDPPALLSAASALVNHLDLQVRAEGLNGYRLLVRLLMRAAI